MEEPEDLRRATELWQEAYRDQMDGELDRAMEQYQRPIEGLPHRGGAHLHGLGPEHPGPDWTRPPTSAAGRSRSIPNLAIHIATSRSI